MSKMSSRHYAKCHAIIHSFSAGAAAVGAGLAQIPGSDSAILVPLQIAMTISLGQVFGISLTEGAAKAALATTATSMVGRAASQVLVGWIPGIGNIINASTAAAVTETAGWVLANDFARETSSNEGDAA